MAGQANDTATTLAMFWPRSSCLFCKIDTGRVISCESTPKGGVSHWWSSRLHMRSTRLEVMDMVDAERRVDHSWVRDQAVDRLKSAHTHLNCMAQTFQAEVNDMIHMGSDHRCVMATFLINTPEKKTNVRRENKNHETTVYVEHEKKAKNTNIEMSELEKRYQDIIVTIKKKPPPKKKTKRMTQETMQKIKWKEKMPQQPQKQRAHLL